MQPEIIHGHRQDRRLLKSETAVQRARQNESRHVNALSRSS